MNGVTALANRLGIGRLAALLLRPTSAVVATVITLNLIRMISSMVLTRLLDVEVFGVIGILTSIIVVFGMLTDLGFAAFIIRHAEGEEPRFLDEIWTIRLIRSVVMSVVVMAGAWPIAHYIGQPQLTPAIAIFGLSSLLEGLTSLAFATAVRHQQIARLSLFDIGSTLVQTVLTIILAAILRSYWAIIYALFLGNFVKIALSYVMFADTTRHWHLNRARAAELWKFSRYVVGASMLTMLITQGDKIVLSRYLPLDLFGLYVIASTLTQIPTNFAYPYASRVLFPKYARIVREAPETLRSQYYSSRRKIMLLYGAAAGGLVTMAPVVIELLYDPRYRGAAFYLQILAIGATVKMNTQAASQAMVALGRLSTETTSNIIRISWLGLAGTAGYLAIGPLGLIIAVGTMEIVAQLYYWVQLRKMKLLDLREEAMIIGAALAGVAAGKLVSVVMLPLIK